MKNVTPYHDAMIVDDEKDLCFLLKIFLEKEHIHAHSVNSLSEMKKRLKNAPKFIFLDNQLPDGTGVNSIPAIKGILPSVKIIVMTAHDFNRANAFNLGADAFLAKPFSRISLHNTLAFLSASTTR